MNPHRPKTDGHEPDTTLMYEACMVLIPCLAFAGLCRLADRRMPLKGETMSSHDLQKTLRQLSKRHPAIIGMIFGAVFCIGLFIGGCP